MKTLKLTAAESRAYAAGERSFWRAMRKQPRDPLAPWPADNSCICWDDFIEHVEYYVKCGYCPYGTPGDRIELMDRNVKPHPKYPKLASLGDHAITAITVTERDGKWGWLVEVGA